MHPSLARVSRELVVMAQAEGAVTERGRQDDLDDVRFEWMLPTQDTICILEEEGFLHADLCLLHILAELVRGLLLEDLLECEWRRNVCLLSVLAHCVV